MSGESVNCLLGHEQGRGLSGSQSPGGWRTTSPPWLPPSAPWCPVLVIALSAATAQLNLPISGNSSCTHPRSLSVTMLTRQLLPSMKYTIPCAIIPSPVITDTPVILDKNTPSNLAFVWFAQSKLTWERSRSFLFRPSAAMWCSPTTLTCAPPSPVGGTWAARCWPGCCDGELNISSFPWSSYPQL